MIRQSAQATGDSALEALRGWTADEPIVLLHSGRYHPLWATRSLIARPRLWFRYTADRRSELNADSSEAPKSKIQNPQFSHCLWPDLRLLLDMFPGRWMGYFSYDLCRLIEPGKLSGRAGDWPLVELAWCPEVEEMRSAECGARDPEAESARDSRSNAVGITSNFTRRGYDAAVRRVLEYIGAGDVFQVNLAQRFTAEYNGEPRDLYERLAAISPAWYGAYLELPGGRAILSTSPELFLRLDGRHVTTRPIKGTLAASSDPARLRLSAKDTAELNMIVDLMRNDLGRVCSYGSVRVTEARAIETHPTIHHGVATIEGHLHESKDVVDLLKATLPGGSVTGAPKVRAMQIIDELEPDPRGPYCGAIGCISKDELHLSIAIRTMLLRSIPHSASRIPHHDVCFSVGGGIVADSKPADEYEETLTKASAMVAALAQPS